MLGRKKHETLIPQLFVEYKPGDIINGHEIKSIFASANNYIVYSAKQSRKAVSFFHRGYPEDTFRPVAALLTQINGMRKRLSNCNRYNSNVAAAYVECLSRNPENAIQILETVKQQIERDFIHEAKIGYLKIFLGLILLNVSISLFFFYTKNYIQYDLLREYFTVATFGSFGGFLSTMYKINRLSFENEDNKSLLFFLSISRVILSMLSSVIIYILIKSNIILGILNKAENIYVYYIFAVVAGFSETFIPDILKKIERKTNEDDNKNCVL